MELNILIVITIICWGMWGIFDKKALQYASNKDVLLMFSWLYVLRLVLTAIVFSLFVKNWHFSQELLFWTFLAECSTTLAVIAYITALSKTEASFVLGITSGYPFLLQFFAYFMLGEQLVLNRLFGSALIGFGIALIGASGVNGSNDQKMSKNEHRQLIVLVIIATVCWGIWGIFEKKAVNIAGPISTYFAQYIWDPLCLIAVFTYLKMQKHKIDLSSKKAFKFSALSVLSLAIASFVYLTALSQAKASYVIAITGCYPLLMYVSAVIFLKEKFNYIRASGISLVTIGGILVQFTQGL